MSVAVSSPVTEAYLSALRALGHPIGDSVPPARPEPTPSSFFPYGVLYTGVTATDGNLFAKHQDGLHRLQLTSVGKTRKSAEYLRDRARAVLLSTDVDIDDHAVVWTELVTGQPINRDDDVTPPMFYAVDVVHVFVTPVASGS